MRQAAVVLDTCVLLPPRLRDTLLDAAHSELFEPYWSAASLVELRRNVVRKTILDAAGAERLIAALAGAFPAATVSRTRYRRLVPRLAKHPKDRHVLATAIVTHAQTIVTFNLRDFPETALVPHGVTAVSPDEFLLDLLQRDQTRVIGSVREQAGRYRSPAMTPIELLDRLGKLVPRFVDRIRGQIQQ